jgi:hypothetical protein
MEPNHSEMSPKPIISRKKVPRSSTYTANNPRELAGKKLRKKVKFVDQAKKVPLITIFNYEPVQVCVDEKSPKHTTSCACFIF